MRHRTFFLSFLLLTRNSIETTILRAPGLMFQENKNGTISNLYNVQIVNKSYDKMPISLRLKNGKGSIKMIGKPMFLLPGEVSESSFFIYFIY